MQNGMIPTQPTPHNRPDFVPTSKLLIPPFKSGKMRRRLARRLVGRQVCRLRGGGGGAGDLQPRRPGPCPAQDLVAIKIVDKNAMLSKPDEKKRVLREITILQQVEHPVCAPRPPAPPPPSAGLADGVPAPGGGGRPGPVLVCDTPQPPPPPPT